MKFALIISSLLFANVSLAGIAPFHIKMALGNEFVTVAESDIHFKPVANHHQIVTKTKMIGFWAYVKKDKVIETTLLNEGENSYLPYQYDFKQTKSDSDKTLHYVWDYDKKKVHQTRNGKKITVKLHKNSYDSNSIILGVASWLKASLESDTAQRKTKSFYFHSKKGGTLQTYKMGAEELLNLPYGKVKAYKFSPIDVKKGEKSLNIWVSANKGYIPVKYEQIKNGKVKVKLELKTIY